MCLSTFWLLSWHIIDGGGVVEWVGLIPHGSGGWKFKVKEPADRATGGAFVSSSWTASSHYVLVWRLG